MSISSRLKDICKNKKIKNIDLVEIGCGSQQTVSFVLSGKNNPNSQFLEIFLKAYPDVDARWLLTGEERDKDLVEDSKTQYGFCKRCIQLEAKLELLMEQCAAKDKQIQELLIKGNQSPGDAAGQADAKKKAS